MIPRTLAALLVALIVAPSAHAQFLHSYGLRIGGNTSTLDADIIDFERRTGFQVAAFAELLPTPVFSVQAEVEYARRGFVSEQELRGADNEPLGVVRATTALDYLSVPVLARVRYPVGAVTAYALAGPRLDFLVGRSPGRFEFSDGTEVEDEFGQNVEGTSLSGSVGIGAAFGALLGREVRVETRYNFGLTDLLPEGDAVDLRHSGFDFSVGVAL
jgi:hypothetical protein